MLAVLLSTGGVLVLNPFQSGLAVWLTLASRALAHEPQEESWKLLAYRACALRRRPLHVRTPGPPSECRGSSQPRDQTQVSCISYKAIGRQILYHGATREAQSSLYNWNLSVHILLKPSMENFEHYFASMWNECSYTVAWTFFDNF